ncbi:(2Fe-2S)-binding protein [Alcaligenaceae bacterium]|nr:(2Fe-2S)-binding protein [Alcaligenaceae bacterium]
MIARFQDANRANAVELVSIRLNGIPLEVAKEMSLAATLLREGELTVRTHPVTHARRAPYCLMGVCFECLLIVDGRQQRACMVTAKAGMKVETL